MKEFVSKETKSFDDIFSATSLNIRRDFFELRALHGQKDHNILLLPVKFSWNHVCLAPRNDFDDLLDHCDS